MPCTRYFSIPLLAVMSVALSLQILPIKAPVQTFASSAIGASR